MQSIELSEMEKIGQVGVDAGSIWLGDFCYVYPNDEKPKRPDIIGNNWHEFCEILDAGGFGETRYQAFGNGIGILVESGYGDGAYDVYIRRDPRDGRIMGVYVDFEGILEEDNEVCDCGCCGDCSNDEESEVL